MRIAGINNTNRMGGNIISLEISYKINGSNRE